MKQKPKIDFPKKKTKPETEIQNFPKPKTENEFSKCDFIKTKYKIFWNQKSKIDFQNTNPKWKCKNFWNQKKTKTNFRESKSDVLKTKPEMEIQNFLKPKTDFQNSNPKSTYNIFWNHKWTFEIRFEKTKSENEIQNLNFPKPRSNNRTSIF